MKKVCLFLLCTFTFGICFAEESFDDLEQRAKARAREIQEEQQKEVPSEAPSYEDSYDEDSSYEEESMNSGRSSFFSGDTSFCGKDEVSVSYGIGSLFYYADKIKNNGGTDNIVVKFSSANDAPAISIDGAFGVFCVDYNHYLTENIYAGLLVTYEKALNDTMAIMPKAGFQYGFDMMKFYHDVSLGLAISGSDNMKFSYNVTLVGVKFLVADNFNFYVDAGLPYKGIINLGFTCTF